VSEGDVSESASLVVVQVSIPGVLVDHWHDWVRDNEGILVGELIATPTVTQAG
jgi:hypothetical protein